MRWQNSHPKEHRKICRNWHINHWERVLLKIIKNEAQHADKVKTIDSGWPDITVGKEWIEIKQGRDPLKRNQIARFNWLEKEFGIAVQIYWYPNKGKLTARWNYPVLQKAKLIKFPNWRSWTAFLETLVAS
jgi:hypothetical protein